MGRLAGRVAIVTGAATGLGRAIARAFAREGARLLLVDIADAAPVAEAIRADGGEASFAQADVGDEAAVERLVAGAADAFGRIDILVNNAAIASSFAPRPFEQIATADWERMLRVNVLGVLFLCRAVAPAMRRQRYGRIINFSSGTAVRGAPKVLHYVASKGAVSAMSLALANELGCDGITVNTIAPGYILTESNLANAAMAEAIGAAMRERRAIPRDGHPDDIVATALHLAEEGAGFVSGQLISVNGGPA